MSSSSLNTDAEDRRHALGRWAALRYSVFAKLVTIMVAMAVSLLLLVGGFFWFAVGPNLHASIDRVWEDYARNLTAGSPDFATAKELDQRLKIQVRYAGPRGEWSTSPYLPSIEDVRTGKVSQYTSLLRRSYILVAAPDGGHYLFAWQLTHRASELHTQLLTLLLLVMAAVIVTTYFVLKRLLAPLRELNDAVARLSAGELDVAVRNQRRDEFGRLTSAFNHMVRRVRGMVEARDQLLLDVSHELRSPLTRMKVALELLPMGVERTGMASDVVEMERMIAELLELERLRSGRGLQKVRQDLRSILREATEAFRDTLPGVRLSEPAEALWVEIDAEKIRRVLRNLLENAAKYASPESRPVEITATMEGEKVCVRVSDDGPGIPESDVERVFEPFYRADRSRSKNTGGYGLGLSLCKRVMQAHGGDIVLERDEAKLERGATFTLTLPRRGPYAQRGEDLQC